jgi:hypothetical protein
VRFFGPTLGVNYAFFDRKLSTSLNTSYLVNQQSDVTGKVITVSANANYPLAKRQTLGLLFNYLNSNTGISNEAFNEFRGNLTYGISF